MVLRYRWLLLHHEDLALEYSPIKLAVELACDFIPTEVDFLIYKLFSTALAYLLSFKNVLGKDFER